MKAACCQAPENAGVRRTSTKIYDLAETINCNWKGQEKKIRVDTTGGGRVRRPPRSGLVQPYDWLADPESNTSASTHGTSNKVLLLRTLQTKYTSPQYSVKSTFQ
jgi:hypothetical protein